jgi:hypothetical protein
MIIVGAGMAGLLAARLLSHHKPRIVEAQPDLPNNHHAVLRFRTSQVGDVLGIPFSAVNMIKDTLPWRNSVADALAYSFKNTKHYLSDRSVTAGLVVQQRFIAPPNLIEQMADGLQIEFKVMFDFSHTDGEPIISTIPMPTLAQALGMKMPKFEYRHGMVLKARVASCDAYASVLVPDPAYRFSRVSVTGNRLVVEYPTALPLEMHAVEVERELSKAAALLGIGSADIDSYEGPIEQPYNKIQPIDNGQRKQFMWWATDIHRIYALGRFATWRPGLLMDDLIQDIRLIDRWVRSRDNYAMAKHRG